MRPAFVLTFFLTGIMVINAYCQLPMKATRTIDIQTDEGSLMDVDVSPDGRTIVFDLLGDLFTVPATGGRATQLTRGLALNFFPVWSPDSRKIAYVSDFSGARHINVRDLSGDYHCVLGKSDEQLHPIQHKPVWSSDGNYIAVDTLIYGLAGGKTALPYWLRNPLLFPGKERFTYHQNFGQLSKYDFVDKADVMIFPRKRRVGTMALSPNRRWIAFVADSNNQKCLLVRDLKNDSERMLVSSLLLQHPNFEPYVQPRFGFSSDSRYVFIGFGGKIHRLDIENGTDVIIPFIADIKADLGPFNYNLYRVLQDSVKVKYARSANASPDGKHLVFSALNRLYVMDLPRGKAHVLVAQDVNQYQPVYSPDGTWIAYVSWSDTAGGFLWRVPASGGQPEKVTPVAGHYERPAWSPDGSSIAVIMMPPVLGNKDDLGRGKLELISLSNGSAKLIADSVPMWNHTAFSEDGHRVIYQPEAGRGKGWLVPVPLLVSRDLTGGNEEILTQGWLPNTAAIQHRTISPDGRFAIFMLREDLYLVPLADLYTPPEVISDAKQSLTVIRFASGIDPSWEEGGKMLSWCYGNRFYRIDPERIVAAARKRVASVDAGDHVVGVSITPDEVVDLNVAVATAAARGVIALRDVRIVTMEQNRVIEHGTVLIRNGRFVAVGSGSQVSIPTGAKTLDLPGTTIIPGFVDMHLHLAVPRNVFPQQSWLFLINLAYGVTTARDPYNTYDAFGYSELIETGQMIGPRLFNVGVGVDATVATDGTFELESLNDARAVVAKRSLMGARAIKQYLLSTRRERQWLAIASRDARVNMTNEGNYEPILQLGQVKDGSTGIEHNSDRGEIYKDILSFFAQSGTYFTPTFQTRYGDQIARLLSDSLYWLPLCAKLQHFSTRKGELAKITNAHPKYQTWDGSLTPTKIAAQIRKAGGRVLLGSHGNDEGIGVHNELWALQMGGLSNMEALQAATIMGAEGLGVQRDLGSIEVGKIADLIILNKNPLDDIHNSREIRYVMKGGVLYDGDTLDEIWPVAKKCPDWQLHADSGAEAGKAK